MKSRALVSGLLGLALVAAGAAVVAPDAARLDRPPRASELLRLTGPMRGLPLPFLWRAWGNAESRNKDRLAIGIGEWLAQWLPERLDLFLYFAWSHAYDLGHSATTAEAKARHMIDAIVLIEKARQAHPNSEEPALLAAFMLMDRSKQEDEAFATAFTELYGESPIELAGRYLATTSVATSKEVSELAELLATRVLARGNLEIAAALLRRLVRGTGRKKLAPQRLAKIRELADLLDRAQAGKARFPADLSPELRAWLIKDPLFGRNPGLWR